MKDKNIFDKTGISVDRFVYLYRLAGATYNLKQSYPRKSDGWICRNAKTIISSQDLFNSLYEAGELHPFFYPAKKSFREAQASGDWKVRNVRFL